MEISLQTIQQQIASAEPKIVIQEEPKIENNKENKDAEWVSFMTER